MGESFGSNVGRGINISATVSARDVGGALLLTLFVLGILVVLSGVFTFLFLEKVQETVRKEALKSGKLGEFEEWYNAWVFQIVMMSVGGIIFIVGLVGGAYLLAYKGANA